MTVAELKKAISSMSDSAEILICNGHSLWKVTDMEINDTDIYDMECIVLENKYMPK